METKLIENAIEKLQKSLAFHLELVEKISQVDNGNVFSIDLFITSAINRSYSNICAYLSLIEKSNHLAAFSFVRLQLDCVLRVYASSLVENYNDFVEYILSGNRIDKYKDKENNKLTDKYLYEKASLIYPWITDVYRETSGFIHLSEKHILMLFKNETRLEIGEKTNTFSNEQLYEATIAMIEISSTLFQFSVDWMKQKEEVGKERTS